ncbi:hypothetical protein JYU16_00495 [bacterium AH-315-M05]|nr:hypothetical protein [bacterium AH-315-M05]
MKTIYKILFALPFIFCSFNGAAGEFKAGEKVKLTTLVNDDLYICAGKIRIDAKVSGDALIAGGEIAINDSIGQDLTIVGGEIEINGYIGDDLRAAGGEVTIFNDILGDAIIMGGKIKIKKGATIYGDLVIFGGKITLDGEVKSNLIIKGGKVNLNGNVGGNIEIECDELNMNGSIQGKSRLAAMKITIGENARFFGDVEYWQKNEGLEFGSSLVNAKAVYNSELKLKSKEVDPGFDLKYLGLGIMVYWILALLSGLLAIILLSLLFKKLMRRSGEGLNKKFMESFGYGVLYIIVLPILLCLTMFTVIGIPVAAALLVLYGLSIACYKIVIVVVAANWINNKYQHGWNLTRLILIAFISLIVLKFILMIPILGIVILFVATSVAFGAIIVSLIRKETV